MRPLLSRVSPETPRRAWVSQAVSFRPAVSRVSPTVAVGGGRISVAHSRLRGESECLWRRDQQLSATNFSSQYHQSTDLQDRPGVWPLRAGSSSATRKQSTKTRTRRTSLPPSALTSSPRTRPVGRSRTPLQLGTRNINNFRVGYLHAKRHSGCAAGFETSQISALGVSGVFTTLPSSYAAGFPTVSFQGALLGNFGSPGNNPSTSDIPTKEFADSFTMIRGKHTIGVGFDLPPFCGKLEIFPGISWAATATPITTY